MKHARAATGNPLVLVFLLANCQVKISAPASDWPALQGRHQYPAYYISAISPFYKHQMTEFCQQKKSGEIVNHFETWPLTAGGRKRSGPACGGVLHDVPVEPALLSPPQQADRVPQDALLRTALASRPQLGMGI